MSFNLFENKLKKYSLINPIYKQDLALNNH